MITQQRFHVVKHFRLSVFLTVFLFWSQLIFATIPTGYYNSATGTGATLKTNLYNIIKNDNHVSYTPGLWTAFYTTDVRADGKVWDMYSDIPGRTPPYEFTLGTGQCGVGGVTAEGQCYSREHSFPKSWFGGEVQPMYTDLFHIVPTDQFVNNMRSNHPYGKVTSPTDTSLNGSRLGPCATPGYTGTVFEPRNEFKGDFARNYFYMATRYENVIASWQSDNSEGAQILDGTSYPCYKTWYLKMLFEWNAQDTVSQKEIDRNNAVYAIQNNRNPFIDHPEYAGAIWGFPTTLTSPATNITASSATLNGSVNPDGVATTYYFEWGTTLSYGNSTTVTSAGSGTSVIIVTANITGLASGTPYHFRLVATNSNGTINGIDRIFTTILPPTLSVTPSDRSVTAPSGSTTFSVTSNTNWTVNSSQGWCTVTPSGSGSGTITANYSTNSTFVTRVSNVTVTVSGLTPIVVTVSQAGATPTLSVTPSNRSVTAPSGSTTFSVSSNTNWTSTSSQPWCTVTSSGSGNGTITATYSQNTTIVPRIAYDTVKVSGLTPVIVTVSQAGAAPTLSVTPSNQDVSNIAGSTTFSVTSNTSWTSSSDQSWCTVTQSGSGNATITANYSQNTTMVPRIAHDTVKVSGLTPVIVTVTQAGVTIAPEPTNFPTNFSAYNIIIHWTDAIGEVVPTGYLIRMSSIGLSNIPIPVDGVPVPNSAADKNVASGVQEAWFSNLTPNTTYYFKIFGYQGSGSSIDYKTDGAVPQVQETTQP